MCIIKSYVSCMEIRNMDKILVGKLEEKKPLELRVNGTII
jgi:hypothetical protein